MQIPMQSVQYDTYSPVGRREKQDWFLRRSASAEQYSWGSAIDPDGRERDRLSEAERVQWVADQQELIGWLRSLPPSVMADIGCGPGWLMREMPQSWDCVGVEICEDAIEELCSQNLSYVRSSADLVYESCDVVVAYHVLEHMTHPDMEIMRIRRALRPGGWLVVGTPDFASPCAVRFGDNYRMLHDPTHVSLFTLESMHRFLRDHGFTIEKLEFPFPLRYATSETMDRWHHTTRISPPWPGNWMTLYCRNRQYG